MITIFMILSPVILVLIFFMSVSKNRKEAKEGHSVDLRVTEAKRFISENYRATPLNSKIWLNSHDSPWFFSKCKGRPFESLSVPKGKEREIAKILNNLENNS